MKNVLILNGSISQENDSYSQTVVEKLVKDYKAKHKDDVITTIDLNKTHSGIILTADNIMEYYSKIESDKWINLLKKTDKVIVISSETNFNVSPVVKNFIDSISVAGETFFYKENEKSEGMLKHLEVLLVTSRGSAANADAWAVNHQWQKGVWNFLGAKKVMHLNITGTEFDRFANLSKEQIQEKYQDQITSVLNEF